MDAKLIKKYNIFYLYVDESWSIASTDVKDNRDKKLSLKNCQAIENGYDLDELFQHEIDELIFTGNLEDDSEYRSGMYKGAKILLELLGDKKFSYEEFEKIKKLNDYLLLQINSKALNKIDDNSFLKNISHVYEGINKEIQSLQQTEWEVEIEDSSISTFDSRGRFIPKLDADGCLILKRK